MRSERIWGVLVMSFSEWREVKVSEIGKIVTGKTPKTAISENYGGNIPFLTPSDDMNIKKVKSTARTLSEMGLNSVKNCLLPAKSICVSCIGSVLGKVVLTSEPTVTNQQINSIVPDEKFDPDFIYYGMTILGKHLNYLSKTSTAVPIINKTTFSNFSIIVPTIEEQKAIAHILSTLDDKIEVNNQINKTLENMAQEIFKQWFVDFEFPNEDGESYKSSGGEMVESELGLIPKGWEVASLYDIADYINGTSFKKNEVNEFEGIPIIKIVEIKNGYSKSTSFYNGTTNKAKKYYLRKRDILFSWSGNPETSIDIFIWSKEQGILNQHIFKVEPYDYSKSYIYFLLKNFKSVFMDIASNKQTTGLGHVTVADLKRLKTPIPNEEILSEFIKISDVIIEKIFNNMQEIETLQSLRDSLLPKLLSGEIRVPLDEEGVVS